jgi:uncharacterized lipoprotein YehR (DUF1307 family)
MKFFLSNSKKMALNKNIRVFFTMIVLVSLTGCGSYNRMLDDARQEGYETGLSFGTTEEELKKVEDAVNEIKSEQIN